MSIHYLILVTISGSHLHKHNVYYTTKQYNMQGNHYICGLSLAKVWHGACVYLSITSRGVNNCGISDTSEPAMGRWIGVLRSQKGTAIYRKGRRFMFISVSTMLCLSSPMPKTKEVWNPSRSCLCWLGYMSQMRNVKIRTPQSCRNGVAKACVFWCLPDPITDSFIQYWDFHLITSIFWEQNCPHMQGTYIQPSFLYSMF